MNKKYIYIMIFSIILIVISCLYILITDVPPKDKYIDNSKNINIRISKNNYVEKKILIENDNQIDNQYEIIPSIKVKAIDSTGAGDIFHGAFTYFIANHYSLREAIRLASITGAISVTRIGSRNSIPMLSEVLDYDTII